MSNVFEQQVNELLQKDPKELATELAILKNSLEAVDSSTQWIIKNIMKPWRFILRNYRPVVGLLIKVFFEPKEFIIWREEDIKDYAKKEVKREQKFTHLKPGSVVSMEIIEHEEQVEWYD